MMDSYMPFVLGLVLFSTGIYAAISKRNLIRIVIGVSIADYAVNLMLILAAYRTGGSVPILLQDRQIPPGAMVDPLPHALVLTSIVIGLATTAFLAAIAMRLHDRYGTYDINRIRELRG